MVRTDYAWTTAVANRQVGAVLNFVASGDWVVAAFPKALEEIGWQDLGSAGHDGFSRRTVFEPVKPDGTRMYVKGGHSAALDEAFWDAIARFVVDDQVPRDLSTRLAKSEALQERFADAHDKWVERLGRVAPLLWVAIVIFLVAILYGLTRLPLREWLRTVIVVAYLALIWTILTKV